MRSDSEYAKLSEIRKEHLIKMPLILHRRIGLQQIIADWAETDIDKLNVTATYNVIHGSPASFVENGIGYFLATRDMLSPAFDNSVVFRPLYPKLKVQYNLVWKRRNIFSKGSKAFLDIVRELLK